MNDEENPYAGREQSQVKHFILEKYLSIACRIIGRSPHWKSFVYVDGFSGPWKSKNHDYSDTSFNIAISVLRRARQELKAGGIKFAARCMFIEKTRSSFAILESEIQKITDLKCTPINGSFREKTDEIVDFVGSDFSFIFIDPTGWKDTSLQTLRPVLNLRGEVMVNFMYRFINRFLTSEYRDQPEQANAIMGGDDWRPQFQEMIAQGVPREEAVIEIYRQRMKMVGGHKFVKSFRVVHPKMEVPYFYLVYCTNHLLGLQRFSSVEKEAFAFQSVGKLEREITERELKTGISDMFADQRYNTLRGNELAAKDRAVKQVRKLLRDVLKKRIRVVYRDLLGIGIERALVWEEDVRAILMEFEGRGLVQNLNKSPNQRTPKLSDNFQWIGP